MLLKSDGTAVACGDNGNGQYDIPVLDDRLTYTQVSAGMLHTVLLRSNGIAVACDRNEHGQYNIPALPTGMFYGNPKLTIFQISPNNGQLELRKLSGTYKGEISNQPLSLSELKEIELCRIQIYLSNLY